MTSLRLNREQAEHYLVLSGGSGADTMERRLAHDWIWAMESLAGKPCEESIEIFDIGGSASCVGVFNGSKHVDCGTCDTCLARAAGGGR